LENLNELLNVTETSVKSLEDEASGMIALVPFFAQASLEVSENNSDYTQIMVGLAQYRTKTLAAKFTMSDVLSGADLWG